MMQKIVVPMPPVLGSTEPDWFTTLKASLTLVRAVPSRVNVIVSTDDQDSSYKAQKKHFMDLLEQHPEWELARIFYADEGISGWY